MIPGWRGVFLLMIAVPCLAMGTQSRAEGNADRADLKVAVWYRRDRPLNTFKYQVYDLRKGEYSAAVDDWLGVMRTRFPTYEVHVRDVVLAREKGATESLRVGSVINRELLAAAAMEGIVVGVPGPRFGQSPGSNLFDRPAQPGLSTLPGLGFSPRIDLGPPRPSFPVPMPYPRPFP